MGDNLTVLIPTRNRAVDLQKSLENLKHCGLHQFKYIIYDDASFNADEIEKAAQVLPRVKVLKGKKRIGQAGGRNILLRECETSYALFMDDDTWFTMAESLPQILAKDLEYDGIGKVSVVCSQVFRIYDGETIFPKTLKTCRIINPLGAGCIVRVKDILKIGGFREYWRYRHEETELGLRLWKHDFPVVYEPSLIVAHCHTAVDRMPREYDHNSARNLILMHVLNLPGLAGFPLGVMRALRLLLIKKYSKTAILSGIGEGFLDTMKYWGDVKPMSNVQYKELCKFKSKLRGLYSGAKN